MGGAHRQSGDKPFLPPPAIAAAGIDSTPKHQKAVWVCKAHRGPAGRIRRWLGRVVRSVLEGGVPKLGTGASRAVLSFPSAAPATIGVGPLYRGGVVR